MASHIFARSGQMIMSEDDILRFWGKVDQSGDCWEWTGAKSRSGHGRVKIQGKLYSPHRVAFELNKARIPKGKEVCHRCNNSGCVNPSHLYAGTRSQNVRDAIRCGAMKVPVGKKFKPTKLTPDKVRQIRSLLADGEGAEQIAPRFNVSPRLIRQIRDRECWATVK